MTWKTSTALLAMQVLATAVLPVTATAERTVLRYDEQLDGMRPGATPAERPSRPFAGWLAVTGCEFPVDGYFSGRVQDGAISGMAAEGRDFNWRIDEHGRPEPQRLAAIRPGWSLGSPGEGAERDRQHEACRGEWPAQPWSSRPGVGGSGVGGGGGHA